MNFAGNIFTLVDHEPNSNHPNQNEQNHEDLHRKWHVFKVRLSRPELVLAFVDNNVNRDLVDSCGLLGDDSFPFIVLNCVTMEHVRQFLHLDNVVHWCHLDGSRTSFLEVLVAAEVVGVVQQVVSLLSTTDMSRTHPDVAVAEAARRTGLQCRVMIPGNETFGNQLVKSLY